MTNRLKDNEKIIQYRLNIVQKGGKQVKRLHDFLT